MKNAGVYRIEPASRSGLVPDGDTRLTANVNSELHRQFKLEAVHQGRTMGECMEEAMRDFLKKHK